MSALFDLSVAERRGSQGYRPPGYRPLSWLFSAGLALLVLLTYGATAAMAAPPACPSGTPSAVRFADLPSRIAIGTDHEFSLDFGFYVARQLGHGAALTMGTYGHAIDELEDAPRLPAEDAIRQPREQRFGSARSPLVRPATTTIGARRADRA